MVVGGDIDTHDGYNTGICWVPVVSTTRERKSGWQIGLISINIARFDHACVYTTNKRICHWRR